MTQPGRPFSCHSVKSVESVVYEHGTRPDIVMLLTAQMMLLVNPVLADTPGHTFLRVCHHDTNLECKTHHRESRPLVLSYPLTMIQGVAAKIPERFEIQAVSNID